MTDKNYVQVEKDIWEVLVSIVTRKLFQRADENGYASLAKLTDSCLDMMDADYSTIRDEEDSGIHLSTREYVLSLSLTEDERQFYSKAPYWIQVVGADSDPEPVQGPDDGYVNFYVEAMMERC